MCIPLGSIINSLKSCVDSLKTWNEVNKTEENQQLVQVTEKVTIILETSQSLYALSSEISEVKPLNADDLDQTLQKMEEISKKFKTKEAQSKELKSVAMSMVEEFESLKEEMHEKALVVKDLIKPEIEKSKKILDNLKQMKEQATKMLTPEEKKQAETLEELINEEIEEFKEDVTTYYKSAMLITETQRYEVADKINELAGNDFKGRAIAKTSEIIYGISTKLTRVSPDDDANIRAGFKLNQIKNSFFTSLTDFIKEPKKSVEEVIENLKKPSE